MFAPKLRKSSLFFFSISVTAILIALLLLSDYSTLITRYKFRINIKDKIYTLSDYWLFHKNSTISNIQSADDKDWVYLGDIILDDLIEFKDCKSPFWLRNDIAINDAENCCGIMIPFHFTGAEFYFNGLLIHRSNSLKNSTHPPITGKPFFREIPSTIIRNGKNILLIHTTDLGNFNQFYQEIKIGNCDKLHRVFLLTIIWYSALTAICLYLALYNLPLFFFRKTEKYYLYFSIFSASFGFWVLGYKGITLWVTENQLFHISTTYLGMISVVIFSLLFIHSFLYRKSNFFIKTIIVLLVALSITILLEYALTGAIYYFKKYLFNGFILICISAIIYGIILCIRSYYDQVLYSNRILLGVSIFGISAIISTIRFFNIILIPPIIIESFFFMVIVFDSILASRYAQLHADLEKSHADLLVLDKLKDDFMATTSHELRTPLHGIMGLTESLLDGPPDSIDEAQRKNLELIHTSANHLTGLVNQILDFNKIQAGRADLYI